MSTTTERVPLRVRDTVNLALTRIRGAAYCLDRMANAGAAEAEADAYMSLSVLLDEARGEIKNAVNPQKVES